MTWLIPWRTIRCPFCFNEVSLGACEIVSSHVDREVLMRHPTGGWRRLLSHVWVSPITGDRSVRELATWRCPSCGDLLPANSDRAEMVVIGLIGGASSGKSHYLAALIHRLLQGDDLRGVGCYQIAPLNQDMVDRYDSNYFRYLFDDHVPIPATAPIGPDQTNRPLIYTLFFRGTRSGRHAREVNLVIYDGSGEQMVIQQELVRFHPYILHSSGLILMLDPLGLPDVTANLPRFLRTTTVDAYAPVHLLQSHLTFYRQQQGMSPTQKIDIPLAVTLSKSDLLRYVPLTLTVPTILRRDSSYATGLDLAETRSSSELVQGILRRTGGSDLLGLTPQFQHVSYHAVSATGGPATSANGTYPSIASSRCLDPLFWLLYEVGVLKADAQA